MALDALQVVQTILVAATGLVYLYVGYRLAKRRVEGPNKLAASLFATWWLVLGGLQIVALGQRIAASLGVLDVAFHVTITEITFLALCVALWALLYYLVFVLTGARRAMLPITVFYAGFYIWILYLIVSLQPTGATLSETGSVTLAYASEPAPWVVGVLLALLLGPVLVAAVGYFRLFFRVEGTTQRYRIGLIAVTLLGWFGSSAIASAAGVSRNAYWAPVSSLLGLAAAVAIYFAYQPPAPLRRRYGLEAIGDEA